MTKKSYTKRNDDEDYTPTNISQYYIKKKKQNTIQNKNSSKWNLQQNQRFLQFVKANRKILVSQRTRRKQRVFLQMSQQIGTRTSDQCRSHHQKMIKHHGDLNGIIQNLEKRMFENLSPLFKIDEQKPIINEIDEKEQKDKKPFFSDTIVDIEMQSGQDSEKNLWDILNLDVFNESPIDILLNF